VSHLLLTSAPYVGNCQSDKWLCTRQMTLCCAVTRPGYISYLCIMVVSVLISYGIYRHGNMLRKCVLSYRATALSAAMLSSNPGAAGLHC
jgi:hypothetical protein